MTGPSGLALTLSLNAIPDSISQDGGSQSSVKIQAIGPDGRGMSGLPLRLDMFVGNVAQDYGTLSARSVVTNNDGVASVIYTAPPGPVNGVFGTCSGLPGNCVAIVATATATNFTTANPEQVMIRLMPTGVILPPASTPTAAFTISPTPVNFNVASIFDASTSCGGTVTGGVCSSSSSIVSYSWNFGDGSTGSGRTVSHIYTQSTSPGNSYNVTLTVTNDRGVTSSTTQAVTVNASPAPSGDWVFSPTAPNVGQTIFFNADAVRPAAGHQLVEFSWNFGDGATASGFQTTHVYSVAATYTVVFSALDDAGQKTTLSKTVVVGSGNPTAALLVNKTGGLNVQADGSATTSQGGTTITNYTFNFGDGTASVSGTSSVASHTYAALGTYTVRLTITDSLGRTGTTTSSVTVP